MICFSLSQLSAEQLTKVGVVDLGQIVTAFYKDSKAIRELQEFWANTEKELEKASKEISELEKQMKSSKEQGDDLKALQYEKEIDKKIEYRKQYYKTQYDRYKSMYDNFGKTDDFFIKVQRAIAAVAVRDSYSLILKHDDTSIVYYSKDIDITEDVLEYIRR